MYHAVVLTTLLATLALASSAKSPAPDSWITFGPNKRSYAPSYGANIKLTSLYCDKVTDTLGDDEVYAVVEWNDDFGSGMSVAPSLQGTGDADNGLRWDMSDKNGHREKIINSDLVKVHLARHGSCEIKISFYESDQSNLGQLLPALGRGASLYFGGADLPKDAQDILRSVGLQIRNPDDYLGSMILEFSDEAVGRTLAGKVQGPGVTFLKDDRKGHLEWHMTNSGADYKGTIDANIVDF